MLGKAFQSAQIQIVGGDGQFFDRVMNAVSAGKSLDGFVNGSDTAKAALREYLEGARSLPEDLTRAVAGTNAEQLKDLSIAALLGQLIRSAPEARRPALQKLLDAARTLGVDGHHG